MTRRDWVSAVLAFVVGGIVYVVLNRPQTPQPPPDLDTCERECKIDGYFGFVIDGVCYCGWRKV